MPQGPGSGRALGWPSQGGESSRGPAQSSPHRSWGCCSVLGSGGSRPLGRERREFILAGCGTGPNPAASAAAGASRPRSTGGWRDGAPPVPGSPAKSSPWHTRLPCLPKLPDGVPARIAGAKCTWRGFSPVAPACRLASTPAGLKGSHQACGATARGDFDWCQLFPCHPAATMAGHPAAGDSPSLSMWGSRLALCVGSMRVPSTPALHKALGKGHGVPGVWLLSVLPDLITGPGRQSALAHC